MPYGHLIAATVMTLDVCQGHSSIASFFLYWQECRAVTCNSRASCLFRQSHPDIVYWYYPSLALAVDALLYNGCVTWATLTRGSAMAKGPRDTLVSRNSATYKTSHLKTRVSGLSCGIICRRTDRRTDRHRTMACTVLSIASHGKNLP